MKKRILKLLIVLAIITTLVACSTPVEKYDYSLEGIVKTLASKEFQGRLTGTEGNEKAIEYITNRFQELELSKWEGDRYYHEYQQKVYPPNQQQHTFKVTFEEGTTKEYIYGRDYIGRPKVNHGAITAPLTLNPEDEKIEEKFILKGERESLSEAFFDAKGIITESSVFFNSTAVSGNGKPSLLVNQEIYEELKSKAVKEMTIESSYQEETITGKNVVGRIEGTDSNKALILSAHFDHVGWEGDTIFYGAVDNASGVSVLLDLAERLKEKSNQAPLDMDIILCAFNGEEWGMLGSKAFASRIKDEYDSLYNINIDCVGKKDGDRLVLEGSDNLAQSLEPYIKQAGIDVTTIDKGLHSDQTAFIEEDIVAVGLLQETLLTGDNRIHTPKDNIDLVDFHYVENVSKALFDFIVEQDGRTFEFSEDVVEDKAEGRVEDDPQVKIDQAVDNARSTLNFDEVIFIEVEDVLCEVTGQNYLKSIEAIQSYYPKVNIPEQILGLDFVLGEVSNGYYTKMSSSKDSWQDRIGDKELNKVYKRDLSMENIQSVTLNYGDKIKNISIGIEKVSEGQSNIILETNRTEKIMENGIEYHLIKNSQTNTITGIYRAIMEKDEPKYWIHIMRMDEDKVYMEITEDLKIPVADNTKEEMIEMVEGIDIEAIIKDLGI